MVFLREQGSGVATAEICRRHGVSPATFFKSKAKFGGRDESEAWRLKAREDDNARLTLADAMPDNFGMKDLPGLSGDARCASTGGGAPAVGLRDERAAGVRVTDDLRAPHWGIGRDRGA